MSVTPDPLLGIALHGVGALSAAWCYTPQKKVRGWSWQSYWLTQAAVCWLILPVVGAALTVPDLGAVLAGAPRAAMTSAFLLGALYGLGGTAFGLAIGHIGFSLTYALAIGVSCVAGTLSGPLLAGNLGETAAKPGGALVFGGVAIGAAGIFLTGIAGRMKEKDTADAGAPAGGKHFAKGLALCLVAGVLSAVYGMALNAGAPIADLAAKHGAGEFQGNVTYIFANAGAFLTTAVYCGFLHAKHGTTREVFAPSPHRKLNWTMAALTGALWYGQFFFYGLGHTRMGAFQFSSWAIHMTLLVLISALVGIVLREWRGARPATRNMLAISLATLIAAVTVITQGNRIGAGSDTPPASGEHR